MTNVRAIIARYRASTLPVQTASVQLSPRTAALRPSLLKIQRALGERPVSPVAVQPSPLAILFDYTLPKLEPLLVELGEERAEQIVSALCEHGKRIIEQHGVEGAKEHLEGLFRDLLGYEGKIREEEEVAGIIEAYRLLDFGGRVKNYLRLLLKDKIINLETDDGQVISLKMASTITDSDLIFLKKVKSLQKLDLNGTQVTDAGVVHLSKLTNLQKLYLTYTQVTNTGLAYLGGLANLQELTLDGTRVADTGLVHLSGLTNLQRMDISSTQVTDAGLIHLSGLTNLRELNLAGTQITDDGLAHLSGLAYLWKLDLGETRVTDNGIVHLHSRLAELRWLDLRGTHVTENGVIRLTKINPELEVFR